MVKLMVRVVVVVGLWVPAATQMSSPLAALVMAVLRVAALAQSLPSPLPLAAVLAYKFGEMPKRILGMPVHSEGAMVTPAVVALPFQSNGSPFALADVA